MTRCAICGGDAWDNHAACMQEEPPRTTRTAPKEPLQPYDTTGAKATQDGPTRAWRDWEAC